MSETLFIADVHLDVNNPLLTHLFMEFLATRARQVTDLYILGDLFEVWIGDDDPDYQPILQALRKLVEHVERVFVMPGNRDFLLGTGFVNLTGCQLLTDPTVIDLYGVPTLLTHGDSVCTQDLAYQAFRQQVRNPLWQQHFLGLPLNQRRLLAHQARAESHQHVQQFYTGGQLQVDTQALRELFVKYQVARVIQGHLHQAGIHTISDQGQVLTCYVLGGWQLSKAIGCRWNQESGGWVDVANSVSMGFGEDVS